MKKREWFYLILILAIAVFFRFYLIRLMPAGLFPDEAANGLDINNIFRGHILPFFARGNGREALFFYFEALSTKLFGVGVWQFSIVSATIGVLSVFSTYLFASKLFDRRTGLLASYLMAVSAWHIVLSRTAFRAIQIPLFLTLMFFFIIKTIQAKTDKERIWSAIFSGVFFAGGFYTYITFRMVPIILGFMAVVFLLIDRKQSWTWCKKFYKSVIIAVIAAVITFLPLAYYFFTHPGSFIGRTGQVSIFNSDLNHGHVLATFIDVFKKSVEAFFIHGDLNYRQNVSGNPFLSPLISPFFGVALVILTALAIRFIWKALQGKFQASDLKPFLLATIFWGMLGPVVATAEGIPHGLRQNGTLAPAYIIAAIGLIYFANWVMHVFWHPKWMEKLYIVVAALFLATIGFLSYVQYFIYADNYANYMSFRGDLTVVSNYLNQHPDSRHTYLVLDLFSLQTVDYLTVPTGNQYIVVDPANAYKLHLLSGDKIVFTGSTLPDADRFLAAHKNQTKMINFSLNKYAEADLLVYQMTKSDLAPSISANPDYSFVAENFGDRIDFAWQPLSFDPWEVKIYLCKDLKCTDPVLLKDDNQNDYLSTRDYILADGKKSDLYFKAVAYKNGAVLKDFGVVKVNKY